MRDATGAVQQQSAAAHPVRLTEWSKWLPVLFVLTVIATIYTIYILCHVLPLLQLDKAEKLRDNQMVQRGWTHFCVFFGLSSVLLLCYVRAILTGPGSIPGPTKRADGTIVDVWSVRKFTQPNLPNSLQETKRSGERRQCKWCEKYKPDRCHHCRVCRVCVLKMDHHCPWIYNCVGHRNHKFFFLLLFYSFLTTQWVVWTMQTSVKRAVDENAEFGPMFTVLFGETLCCFLTVLVTAFFGFHIWLMLCAMTTIEFCEKSLKKAGFFTSVYNRGFIGNIQEVLGQNPLLWLLPIKNLAHEGLDFTTERTPIHDSHEPSFGHDDDDNAPLLGPPPGTGPLASQQ